MALDLTTCTRVALYSITLFAVVMRFREHQRGVGGTELVEAVLRVEARSTGLLQRST